MRAVQAEATSLDPGGPAPNLTFYGKNGEERASIGATPIASSLLLYDFAGKPRVTLGNLGTNVPMIQLDSDGAMAQLLVSMDGPHLTMEDKEGFAIEVGNSSTLTTKTGQTHHNSAASVVLFGKDKKVLWSAP